MSERLDIPQSTYNNWESEVYPVKSRFLPDIAEILGVRIDDLFEDRVNIINEPKDLNKLTGRNELIINVYDSKIAEKLNNNIRKLILILEKQK